MKRNHTKSLNNETIFHFEEKQKANKEFTCTFCSNGYNIESNLKSYMKDNDVNKKGEKLSSTTLALLFLKIL